jgi:hypothetical protein
MNKAFITLLLISLYQSSHSAAGDDLIFKDDFETTENEANCPSATPMTQLSDSNGIYYDGVGTLNSTEDKAYFTVPVSSEQWLQIATDSGDSIDSFLSVYSADGTNLLAQNDDDYNTPSNSQVYYKNTSESSLCIKFEDVFSATNTSVQGTGLNYIVRVRPINFSLQGFNLESEPNDSIGQAEAISTFSTFGNQIGSVIMAEQQNNTDIDTFFTTSPVDSAGVILRVAENGNTGYGGTSNLGILELINPNGIDVLAQVTPENGVQEIFVPIQPSTQYYIRTRNPVTPRGDNPFYFLQLSSLDQINPQETNEVGNNTAAGAETPSAIPNGASTSYFIGGNLAGGSDADWWQFDAQAGDTVNLFCSSWFIGSGVRNFTASVYFDPMMSSIQTGAENQTTGLSWSENSNATAPAITISSSGTHYLEIEADQFSADVLSRHYQCGIHISS